MYRIAEGSTRELPDVAAFIELLNGIESHPTHEARTLFDLTRDLFVARAPGRLDVMGGIADYSGSLVLQMPIREATLAAVQLDDPENHSAQGMLRIVSLGADAAHRYTLFEMPMRDLESGGKPIDYSMAQAYFKRDPLKRWAAYIAGALLVLRRECPHAPPITGARILISSQVPEGKGVSSSAALEIAALKAICSAGGIEMEPRALALLGQKIENFVVGAPCGVMDQMTAVCGEQGKLMALLCQPAELQGMVSIPSQLAVWRVDSGIRHAVSGSDYTSVRVGAFMGYRILEELARASSTVARHRLSEAPLARGYLANITPSEFARFTAALPKEISGSEFLDTYGPTRDTVTQIDPEKKYKVRTPAAHPVHEHFRVRTFVELLQAPQTERSLELLGELMYQSHASYSACGLGSEGTDTLVASARIAGCIAPRIYGAKITGGGSGGTVAMLGQTGAGPTIETIAEEYQQVTGRAARIFSGSSPGANAFGHLRLVSDKE